MSTSTGKWLRLLVSTLSVLVLLVAGGVAWFYFQMRASLPVLDGTVAVSGLGAPITITRDALGIPAVRGQTRADVVRALGFLHAQDRFFQMDLLRRRSAGELSELFGSAALPIDRATRIHGFRRLAHEVAARLPADQRELVESYTAGVNAGLAALKKKPFEYLVLRTTPQPWKVEDSVLVVYTMTLDLQDSTGSYELALTTLRDQLGTAGVEFFAPVSLPDDAALDGSTGTLAPIPPPANLDLRTAASARRHSRSPLFFAAGVPRRAPEEAPGSNSFALSGAHTASGVALLANDPHLDLGVPNIWYRALLEWKQPAARQVVGVTLPGLPAVVLGSNGHIAWGFTDAYADTSDLVALESNPHAPTLYRVPGQNTSAEVEVRHETILVKGGDPVTVDVPWTRWGPIIATGSDHRPLVLHWLAHDPAATDFEFMHLADTTDVTAAVAVAHRAGIPAHNFLVADTTGQIAWTIIGRLPKRIGFDGRLPTTWSFGDRHWDGMLPPDEVPTILAPDSGRLWTANNRLVGGAGLERIGDGGYANAPRAAQIRDDLAPLEKATPADLRAIQLDDRAVFLGTWQKLLLATLTPEAVAGHPSRAEYRRLVEHWDARASVDSVGYRLVRAFRVHTADQVFNPIFAGCVEQMPEFDWRRFHYEAPLQALLREQPAHLLSPRYASWDALKLAAVDAVIADFDRRGLPLDRATWGQHNIAKIYHPFGHILPKWLAGWLNMPADPLPGDVDMPRVQSPSFGASMRMVVSPGRESEGLLHMAGGESGHPLSDYYRAGFMAWEKGEPTPLLPGPAAHTLTLAP